jgi:hypothetical protein
MLKNFNQSKLAIDLLLWTILMPASNALSILLAFSVLRDQARLGLIVVLVIYWFAGCIVLWRMPHLSKTILMFTLSYFFSQFVPVYQLVIGLISLKVMDVDFSDDSFISENEFTKGFFATLIAAALYTMPVILLTLFVKRDKCGEADDYCESPK